MRYCEFSHPTPIPLCSQSASIPFVLARACDQGMHVRCRLQGKIFFQLRDYTKAEAAYQTALKEQPHQLTAWKGLAELHIAAGNTAAAAAAYESLVSL